MRDRFQRLTAALILAAIAAACGEDGPTSPSPIGPEGANSAGTSTNSAWPAGYGGAETGPVTPGRSLNTDTSDSGTATTPGTVTNLTNEHTGCPTDTPPNAVTISWNPPSSGASVASYKVSHFGTWITKYVWSPGVTVPEVDKPWSGGECTVSGSTTTCSIVADSFSHGTHEFSVTARTADYTEGLAAHTSVEVDDCSSSGTTTTTDAAPGTVRDLTVTQTSGTLNVVVAWNKPTSQSGVSEATSYSVTGEPLAKLSRVRAQFSIPRWHPVVLDWRTGVLGQEDSSGESQKRANTAIDVFTPAPVDD